MIKSVEINYDKVNLQITNETLRVKLNKIHR